MKRILFPMGKNILSQSTSMVPNHIQSMNENIQSPHNSIALLEAK